MFLKRIAKRIAAPFRSRGVILLYHRVASIAPDRWSLCVSREHFEQHMSVLRKFRPLRLEDIAARPLPRSVAVTFDDGYADNLTHAKPVIEKYGIPATFFLATGYIGGSREFWWDELEQLIFQPESVAETLDVSIGRRFDQHTVSGSRLEIHDQIYDYLQPLAQDERRETLERLSDQIGHKPQFRQSHRQLSPGEISELSKCEFAEIGAHTVTHPRLSTQSLRDQKTEIECSKIFLEELAGAPVATFSYPYGGSNHYSLHTCEIVRQAGYRFACTTNPQAVTRLSKPYELPRLNIGDMDGDRFERLLESYCYS